MMPLFKINSTGKTLQATVEFMKSNHFENYEEVKQADLPEWELIKEKRTKVLDEGAEVDGKWFHSDAISKIQQLGLMIMGNNIPAGLQWKTMDGSFVTMTPTLAIQIFNSVVAREQAVFAVAEMHRAELMKSVSPSTYDFMGVWPLGYIEQP
jgi:hypothetical protein